VTAFKRDANSPLKLGVCRADLDDERVTILLWVVVVYGCPAHPNLGKEHGEHRSRPLVSEAAVASEDRRDNAIADQRLQLCGARGNLRGEMLAQGR
jgi:hypothetical protein